MRYECMCDSFVYNLSKMKTECDGSAAMCFEEVGTGATKDLESCGKLQKHLFGGTFHR